MQDEIDGSQGTFDVFHHVDWTRSIRRSRHVVLSYPTVVVVGGTLNPKTFVDLNPYEPPRHGDKPEALDKRRRYVPMVFFAGGFAMFSIIVGLLVASEAFGISQRQGFGPEIVKGYMVASGFAVLAVFWAGSSMLYWTRRNLVASIINVGAFVAAGLFVVLLSLGMVP